MSQLISPLCKVGSTVSGKTLNRPIRQDIVHFRDRWRVWAARISVAEIMRNRYEKNSWNACFGIHHPHLCKCHERPLRSCCDFENASVLVRNFSWQYHVAHSAAVELHRYVFENYICKREEDHGVNPVLAAEWNALKALSAILNFYWLHSALISKFDDLMDFPW